ncbi:MAG: hypothetical protein IJ879_09030, partial [Muribaculaceae bacterium]|nr:hypothetical protein [Muribaculaceae bacterium]
NQQMPDSVLVINSQWLIVVMDNDGMMRAEAPMSLDSKIVTMNPAPNGNIYLLYNNQELGLDAQLLTHELNNQWDDPVTVEDRPLSSGMFMPTPLTALADDDVLFISYRVLTDFYGFQVVNSLNPNGATAPEGVSLTGHFDGDAGTAQMGVKQDRAFVAWEYAYSASEKYMNVNVVDNNNNYFWTDEAMYGLYLDISFDWGFTPVKVIPVSDGWVVLYGISTSWNGATFMVEKLDELGNTVWAKQICEEDFKSSGFSITYDENYAYIFYTQEEEYDDNWDVIPGSGGMYVMCIDIKGDHTAINEVPTGEGIVSTEIYTIDGRRVNQLEKGVNIVRTTDANGNVTTTKVLY